jgi:hypothetical protein
MSGKAKEYLENQGIKASAEQIVSRILNKSRTGQCPMEERCTDLEPEECYNAAKCRYILSQQSL